MIENIGVNSLKLMGLTNITDEDIRPYRPEYKEARERKPERRLAN